ncbi:hypothetical protein C0J52_10697 [Blattella germanica]|nr:hypothetical protein C0J52_10697 [Blattella germanica]
MEPCFIGEPCDGQYDRILDNERLKPTTILQSTIRIRTTVAVYLFDVKPTVFAALWHTPLSYKTQSCLFDQGRVSSFLFMLQSEERGGAHIRPSRRSKSEGPPTGTTAGAPPGPALSEYRLQYMNMASPPPRAVRSDSDPCVDEEMVGEGHQTIATASCRMICPPQPQTRMS